MPKLSPVRFARAWRATITTLMLLGLVLPANAIAQEPLGHALPADVFDANQVVEHWEGTGQISGIHRAEERFFRQQWMEPGEADVTAETTYRMQVDANGNINGTMRVDWSGSTWLTSGARAWCNPARAENALEGFGCKLAPPPGSGSYTQTITGKRTRNSSGAVEFAMSFSLAPRIMEVLSGTDPDYGPWTHRRPSDLHEILGKTQQKIVGVPEPGWSTVVVNHHDDRDFLYESIASGSFVRIYQDWTYDVRLVETGGKPTLALDKELLERSIFMDAVPVNNGLTANLNWMTAGGGSTAWRLVNQDEETPVSPVTTIPRTVNVGQIGVGEHEVRVQGKDTLDRKTIAEAVMLQVAPYFAVCPSFTASKEGEVVTYKCSVTLPDPAFEAKFNVPGVIPFFGGKALGVGKTQFGGEVELRSTGEGSLKGEGGTTFAAMGGEVGGSASVKGDFVFLVTGAEFKSGALTFTLKGKIAKVLPLTDAIPALKPAFVAASTIAPAAIAKLESIATANLEIEPKIGVNFLFEKHPDPAIGWRFKDATVPIGTGFKVYVKLEPVEGMLSLSGGVGGDVNFTFDLPADPDYVQAVDLKFLAYYTLQVWKYTSTGEKAWGWSYNRASAAETITGLDDIMAAGAGTWEVMNRAYLSAPNYSRWVNNDPALPGRVLENVGPLAKPELWHQTAANGHMVWSYEKPGSNPNNGDELAFARVNGTGMIQLTNDDRSDWNPDILRRGNFTVVVSERFDSNNPGDFSADPNAFLSHVQVAAGFFNHTVATPTMTPVQISTSGSLNHRPSVVEWGADAKDAMAVWVNNTGNQLIGDSANPDQFMFALRTNNTDFWTAPAVAVPNIAGIISYDVAMAQDDDTFERQVVLVYLADLDGNPATQDDAEVFYSIYSSLTDVWSAPVRLTTNTVSESDVQINLDAPLAGGIYPEVFWRAGDQIMHIDRAWDVAPVALPVTLAPEANKLTLIAESGFGDGHLAVTWQQGSEIGLVRRLGTDADWTHAEYITPAPGLEGQVTHISGQFVNASGDKPLRLISQIEETANITRTVGGVAYPNVPVVTQRHVYSSTVYMTDAELAVSPTITVTPTAAEVNAPFTVQAEVRNLGAETAENIVVRLVQDNLTGADVVLAEQTIPALVGNGAVVVTLTGQRPASGDYSLMVRAEADSTTAFALLPVDAALQSGPSFYGPRSAISTVWLRQGGALAHAPVVPLIVTRDAPDGAEVARVGARLAITPTASVQASAAISPAVLGPGTHILYWRVDEEGITDTNTANNWTNTVVHIMPDLAVDPLFTEAGGGQARFRVTNLGNWQSSASIAEVWSAPPGTPGRSKVATLNVPALPSGASATVQGALAAGGGAGMGYYLILDPANAIQESNENNNHVVLTAIGPGGGGGSIRVWLPIIDR